MPQHPAFFVQAIDYLLRHERGNANDIARALGLHRKEASEGLRELQHAGLVFRASDRRADCHLRHTPGGLQEHLEQVLPHLDVPITLSKLQRRTGLTEEHLDSALQLGSEQGLVHCSVVGMLRIYSRQTVWKHTGHALPT